MDKGNGRAYYMLASSYAAGINGMPQDYRKANELYLKGGELGSADAYNSLGQAYRDGDGVEADQKKAKYYLELAAIKGCTNARHNLGNIEFKAGNVVRAMKHYLIAARSGLEESLDMVKHGFIGSGLGLGLITKDEYANTLRAYHEQHKEMKSDERDKAVIYYASG